jgi:hypothetical protein
MAEPIPDFIQDERRAVILNLQVRGRVHPAHERLSQGRSAIVDGGKRGSA